MVKNPSNNAIDIRNMSSIPRSKRSPGEGNGNALQYSCLENLMDRRSLVGYRVYGVTKSEVTSLVSNSV